MICILSGFTFLFRFPFSVFFLSHQTEQRVFHVVGASQARAISISFNISGIFVLWIMLGTSCSNRDNKCQWQRYNFLRANNFRGAWKQYHYQDYCNYIDIFSTIKMFYFTTHQLLNIPCSSHFMPIYCAYCYYWIYVLLVRNAIACNTYSIFFCSSFGRYHEYFVFSQ